jgi:hypothetical protein
VEITAIVGIAKIGSPLGRVGGVPVTVDFARRRSGPHETSIRNRKTSRCGGAKNESFVTTNQTFTILKQDSNAECLT